MLDEDGSRRRGEEPFLNSSTSLSSSQFSCFCCEGRPWRAWCALFSVVDREWTISTLPERREGVSGMVFFLSPRNFIGESLARPSFPSLSWATTSAYYWLSLLISGTQSRRPSFPLHDAESCSSYRVIMPGLSLRVYHRTKKLDSFVLSNQRGRERGLAKESKSSLQVRRRNILCLSSQHLLFSIMPPRSYCLSFDPPII